MLPFFKRSEAYEGGESEYHGASGELCVSDLRNDHPYCEAWLAAGAEAGYPLHRRLQRRAHRRPRPLPADAARPLALRRGDGVSRAGAPAAEPHASLTGAHVTRVIVEGGARRRRRVGRGAAEREGARADGEVILAAGALQSPQLLQLSGIGPAALLRGTASRSPSMRPRSARNLQDHYQARVIVKLKEKRSLNDDVRNPLGLAQMGAQWLFGQRGPLTVGAGQVGGLRRTEHARAAAPTSCST